MASSVDLVVSGVPPSSASLAETAVACVLVHEHAHGGLAAGELGRDPVAVLGLEAETLVMEGAQEPAADDAGEQGRRGDHRQHEADPGALADAALAELVGLELAFVIEDEDADGVELDVLLPCIPGLHLLHDIVRLGLVVEEGQDDGPFRHVSAPLAWALFAGLPVLDRSVPRPVAAE